MQAFAANSITTVKDDGIFGEVTDVEKATEIEVRSILNKLTPQNFEKLTAKLGAIQIGSANMLDKLINLVFDKAVMEPNFANLYADICRNLNEKSRTWSFLQVVHEYDNNKYLWLKDLQFDNNVAGPYMTVGECVEACTSEDDLQTTWPGENL